MKSRLRLGLDDLVAETPQQTELQKANYAIGSKEAIPFSEKEIARFWSGVNKTATCWLWTKSTDKCGYGRIKIGRDVIRTHRFAWLLANETIPNGLSVLHKCDIPHCVNPAHLFLGTQSDNVADMVKKGRNVVVPKLTEEDVLQIRALAGQLTCREIGKKFNISYPHVSWILNRKCWQHL